MKYYDYKPIPRFKEGDEVYRVRHGLYFHTLEKIRKVEVRFSEYQQKWYIDYLFPRERIPTYEECVFATLEEIVKAEVESIITNAKHKLEYLKAFADKKGLEIKELPKSIELKE